MRRLALVLLLGVCPLACPPAGLRPPPAAVAAVAAQRPTLARIQGNLWVVGLPPRHGWARERRVLLTQRDPERGVDLKVGVVVVLDDSYATAAPVGIVYEEPGASFDGALAEVLPTDQRLRVGRGFGALSAVVTTALVEIDLGSKDGVGVGDVYEVRGPGGTQSIGRVQVMELSDTRAKATVINAGPMAVGQEVVYQAKSADEHMRHDGVKIVVCDFAPKAQDKNVAAAGQAFAFDLAKHLQEAARSWQGLTVMQVPQMVADHEPARKLGRAYQADIVVWGTAMCFEGKGCAQPVYTVVDPDKMAHAEREGREVRFDPLSPGRGIQKGTVQDPAAMVMGLLGELAFDAQRYGDAAFYLGRVPEGTLEGADQFRSLQDRGYSLYFLGRIEAALTAAGRLEQVAQEKDRVWTAVGVGQRADILKLKGQVDEALKLYREALAVYEALGERRLRAVTLGDIARILTDKGQVDEALKLHKERLAVFEALGERHSRAVTLGDIARILTDKGQVDEALKLHKERLAVFEALGERRSRAVTLGDIARILKDMGQVDEALKLHKERLAVFEALGERRGQAVALGDIARILKDMGQVDEALKLLREALAIVEALGNRRDRAGKLFDVARILTDKGQIDEALKLLREALAVYEALGERRARAVTLGAIARILTDKGQIDEALKLLYETLAVFEALGDRRERAVALFRVAQIHLLRKNIPAALPLLRESYEIAVNLGDAYVTTWVGPALAETLLDTGASKEAEPIVARAAEAFTKIGRRQQAAALRARLAGKRSKPP